jgi:hypothetical protein
MTIRKRLGSWLRRLAEWLDPTPETVADKLFPLALQLVKETEKAVRSGSIKHLVVMKKLEQLTGESRLHINEAIERAVRTLRAERGD